MNWVLWPIGILCTHYAISKETKVFALPDFLLVVRKLKKQRNIKTDI